MILDDNAKHKMSSGAASVFPSFPPSLNRINSATHHFSFSVLKDKFRVQPEDVGGLEGGSARLDCVPPKGSPPPTVFWKRNGRIVDVETEPR